ncbi:MAG: dCMP deaminase family protein [Firmicutes bacterium]|nr:dCMP deaminase family protein [Bacillota bacterium]
MDLAELVARRSTCLRRQVGAVLVDGEHIISTGYNGAPTGLPHCFDTGCLREQLQVPPGERHELCVSVHAEQNVIIQAALHGSSTKGATLYCTHQPCSLCAKMIINAQIRKIVFKGDYPDTLAQQLLEAAGVELVRMSHQNGEKDHED